MPLPTILRVRNADNARHSSGIEPLKSLPPNMATVTLRSSPIDAGSVPVSLLFDSATTSAPVAWLRLGIGPDSWLCDRSSSEMAAAAARTGGMEPRMWLSLTTNQRSRGSELKTAAGSVPSIALRLRSNTTRFETFATSALTVPSRRLSPKPMSRRSAQPYSDSGMEPLSRFLLTMTLCSAYRSPIRGLMVPVSLRPERSNHCSCEQA
mmetsp:Transcript_26924/g.93447  ORF Transcript_26924/g.93447 Transcript_26924/m.93447 type:complete len:208 (-) Transcript_26924:1358-1981(-)